MRRFRKDLLLRSATTCGGPPTSNHSPINSGGLVVSLSASKRNGTFSDDKNNGNGGELRDPSKNGKDSNPSKTSKQSEVDQNANNASSKPPAIPPHVVRSLYRALLRRAHLLEKGSESLPSLALDRFAEFLPVHVTLPPRRFDLEGYYPSTRSLTVPTSSLSAALRRRHFEEEQRKNSRRSVSESVGRIPPPPAMLQATPKVYHGATVVEKAEDVAPRPKDGGDEGADSNKDSPSLTGFSPRRRRTARELSMLQSEQRLRVVSDALGVPAKLEQRRTSGEEEHNAEGDETATKTTTNIQSAGKLSRLQGTSLRHRRTTQQLSSGHTREKLHESLEATKRILLDRMEKATTTAKSDDEETKTAAVDRMEEKSSSLLDINRAIDDPAKDMEAVEDFRRGNGTQIAREGQEENPPSPRRTSRPGYRLTEDYENSEDPVLQGIPPSARAQPQHRILTREDPSALRFVLRKCFESPSQSLLKSELMELLSETDETATTSFLNEPISDKIVHTLDDGSEITETPLKAISHKNVESAQGESAKMATTLAHKLIKLKMEKARCEHLDELLGQPQEDRVRFGFEAIKAIDRDSFEVAVLALWRDRLANLLAQGYDPFEERNRTGYGGREPSIIDSASHFINVTALLSASLNRMMLPSSAAASSGTGSAGAESKSSSLLASTSTANAPSTLHDRAALEDRAFSETTPPSSTNKNQAFFASPESLVDEATSQTELLQKEVFRLSQCVCRRLLRRGIRLHDDTIRELLSTASTTSSIAQQQTPPTDSTSEVPTTAIVPGPFGTFATNTKPRITEDMRGHATEIIKEISVVLFGREFASSSLRLPHQQQHASTQSSTSTDEAFLPYAFDVVVPFSTAGFSRPDDRGGLISNFRRSSSSWLAAPSSPILPADRRISPTAPSSINRNYDLPSNPNSPYDYTGGSVTDTTENTFRRATLPLKPNAPSSIDHSLVRDSDGHIWAFDPQDATTADDVMDDDDEEIERQVAREMRLREERRQRLQQEAEAEALRLRILQKHVRLQQQKGALPSNDAPSPSSGTSLSTLGLYDLRTVIETRQVSLSTMVAIYCAVSAALGVPCFAVMSSGLASWADQHASNQVKSFGFRRSTEGNRRGAISNDRRIIKVCSSLTDRGRNAPGPLFVDLLQRGLVMGVARPEIADVSPSMGVGDSEKPDDVEVSPDALHEELARQSTAHEMSSTTLPKEKLIQRVTRTRWIEEDDGTQRAVATSAGAVTPSSPVAEGSMSSSSEPRREPLRVGHLVEEVEDTVLSEDTVQSAPSESQKETLTDKSSTSETKQPEEKSDEKQQSRTERRSSSPLRTDLREEDNGDETFVAVGRKGALTPIRLRPMPPPSPEVDGSGETITMHPTTATSTLMEEGKKDSSTNAALQSTMTKEGETTDVVAQKNSRSAEEEKKADDDDELSVSSQSSSTRIPPKRTVKRVSIKHRLPNTTRRILPVGSKTIRTDTGKAILSTNIRLVDPHALWAEHQGIIKAHQERVAQRIRSALQCDEFGNPTDVTPTPRSGAERKARKVTPPPINMDEAEDVLAVVDPAVFYPQHGERFGMGMGGLSLTQITPKRVGFWVCTGMWKALREELELLASAPDLNQAALLLRQLRGEEGPPPAAGLPPKANEEASVASASKAQEEEEPKTTTIRGAGATTPPSSTYRLDTAPLPSDEELARRIKKHSEEAARRKRERARQLYRGVEIIRAQLFQLLGDDPHLQMNFSAYSAEFF